MLVVRIGGKQYRASEESIRRSGAGKYIVAHGGADRSDDSASEEELWEALVAKLTEYEGIEKQIEEITKQLQEREDGRNRDKEELTTKLKKASDDLLGIINTGGDVSETLKKLTDLGAQIKAIGEENDVKKVEETRLFEKKSELVGCIYNIIDEIRSVHTKWYNIPQSKSRKIDERFVALMKKAFS